MLWAAIPVSGPRWLKVPGNKIYESRYFVRNQEIFHWRLTKGGGYWVSRDYQDSSGQLMYKALM